MIRKGLILNTSEILERLKLDSKTLPLNNKLKTLNILINAFLQEVPYENIDFFNHKIPSFHILSVYKKIVQNNRGGICYESNTLFAYLLKELSFNVHMIFAKVKDLSYIGAEFPHLALIVTLENKNYLVDVGFGQNVREALDISNTNYKTSYENIEYYMKHNKNVFTLFSKYKNKEKESYSFSFEKISFQDYENMFEKLKKDDNKATLLVSKAKNEGRMTLKDTFFTIRTEEVQRKWNVSNENKNEVLRDYF